MFCPFFPLICGHPMSRHWCHKFLTFRPWQNPLIIKHCLLCVPKGRVNYFTFVFTIDPRNECVHVPHRAETILLLILCKSRYQMLVPTPQPMSWGFCLLHPGNGLCTSWLPVCLCRMLRTAFLDVWLSPPFPTPGNRTEPQSFMIGREFP